MKHLDAIITTTTTTVIIIIMFSGNSSECRLEVSAATLADHGTWTCSLSQDKVSMMLPIMLMLINYNADGDYYACNYHGTWNCSLSQDKVSNDDHDQ